MIQNLTVNTSTTVLPMCTMSVASTMVSQSIITSEMLLDVKMKYGIDSMRADLSKNFSMIEES